jgi:hypothetical protein
VDDEMEFVDGEVQELSTTAHRAEEESPQGADRRIERLQGSERDDVEASDGTPVESSGEVAGKRLHLGQFGHEASLPAPSRKEPFACRSRRGNGIM